MRLPVYLHINTIKYLIITNCHVKMLAGNKMAFNPEN